MTTYEQTITSQLEEAISDMSQHRKATGGQPGDDFPAVRNAAIDSRGFRLKVGVNLMKIIMTLVMVGKKDLEEDFDSPEKLMENDLLSGPFMEIFYVGYKLGRKAQRHEDAELARIGEK